jgi:membrane protein
MRFPRTLDLPRLAKGALLLGAIVAAWKLEQPDRSPETATAAAAVPRDEQPGGPSLLARWKTVLLETYQAMSEDRLVAVAAGVVFYALLAIFPAITAFVSFYGLFADPATVQRHLSLLTDVMPANALSIVQEQIDRIAGRSGELSIGFIGGLALALWSANAGVKAMIDALNVVEEHDERRSFIRLNALSLAFTLGAIAFLLCAVGAVVAFPLVMSTFGLKDLIATDTWLVRWPALFALVLLMLVVLYRFGPNRDRPRERWLTPGALFAALAWLAGSAALSFYLSNFADYNATYGSLGAGIGLMMWMWISAIAVLMGAELDTVLYRLRQRGR